MKKVQKYGFLFLMIFCSIVRPADSAEIIEIQSCAEIDFDAMTPGDVMLFDVDDVLIEPSDVVQKHVHKKEVVDSFYQYVSHNESEECVSIMLRDTKKVLIEKDIVEKIRKLKERGVTVLALTSCRVGKFGVIESCEQMRHELLQKFGFMWSFENEICAFNHLKKIKKEYAPLFFKGIIIVGGYSKGEALDAFLTWKSLAPARIFFVDNTMNHLLFVRKACNERSIPFIGYHYLGGPKAPLDETFMHIQFQHLSQHKEWLSDSALMERVNPQSKPRKYAEAQSDEDDDFEFE